MTQPVKSPGVFLDNEGEGKRAEQCVCLWNIYRTYLSQSRHFTELFTGHDPAPGPGQEVFKTSVGRVRAGREVF